MIFFDLQTQGSFPSLCPQVGCVSVSSHDALGRVGVGQDAAGCGGSGQRSRGARAVSAAAVDVFSLREHLQTGSHMFCPADYPEFLPAVSFQKYSTS